MKNETIYDEPTKASAKRTGDSKYDKGMAIIIAGADHDLEELVAAHGAYDVPQIRGQLQRSMNRFGCGLRSR